jgi:ribonuclease BN (tRNA processing enzyme)
MSGSIKFLGTAGARFVVIKQLRASGGLWVNLKDTNILIDPGPGTLVKCATSRPKLDPLKLDGIILTHRHLDHSGDINVMIEAMTDGGFKKRGIVFAPEDALTEDPVILKYIREHLERIEVLKEGGKYSVGAIDFSTPKRHIHGSETYGLNIKSGRTSISLITDTRYFEGLEKFYDGDVLVINCVFHKPRLEYDHLSFSDAERIIRDLKPKVAILTHFGMTMLQAKPHKLAEELKEKLGREVIAAYDGMNFEIS